MDWQNVRGCGCGPLHGAGGDGEPEMSAMCSSDSVGELGAEDEALDALDMMDSSLIFV
jgi:hypothetical protein